MVATSNTAVLMKFVFSNGQPFAGPGPLSAVATVARVTRTAGAGVRRGWPASSGGHAGWELWLSNRSEVGQTPRQMTCSANGGAGRRGGDT